MYWHAGKLNQLLLICFFFSLGVPFWSSSAHTAFLSCESEMLGGGGVFPLGSHGSL